MKRWRLVGEVLLVLALAGAFLGRPGPRPILPYTEVTARLSADGQTVAFSAQRGGLPGRLLARRGSYPGAAEFTDVYRTDLASGQTHCLSRGGNGPSYQPALSPNGRWLAFCSEASNLVEGDRNACSDIFLSEAGGALRRLAPPRSTPAVCRGRVRRCGREQKDSRPARSPRGSRAHNGLRRGARSLVPRARASTGRFPAYPRRSRPEASEAPRSLGRRPRLRWSPAASQSRVSAPNQPTPEAPSRWTRSRTDARARSEASFDRRECGELPARA